MKSGVVGEHAGVLLPSAVPADGCLLRIKLFQSDTEGLTGALEEAF